MREETDMALLRFRTREPDFSGTTALALTNKLTGETESWSLEFASGAVAGEAVKTTAFKASRQNGFIQSRLLEVWDKIVEGVGRERRFLLCSDGGRKP